MKKPVLLVFMFVLFVSFSAYAQIPYADTDLDFELMAARLGVTKDENGDFTACDIKAQAIENLFYDKIATFAANGMMMFSAAVEGNADTGISYPVLKILYAGPSALNVRYAVFAVDEDRFDVRVTSSVQNVGRYRVETMKAYLTDTGFEMLERIKNAGTVSIALLGDDMYVQKAEKAKFYASQKNEIAAECLDALNMPVGAPDYTVYDLDEIAENAFIAKNGAKTEILVRKVNAVSEYPADKTFGLFGDGAPAASIRSVQELLKGNGFMTGMPATTVSNAMIKAVRSAQAYYGLSVTGFADAALVNALSGERVPAALEKENEKHEYALNADKVAFSIDKWWHAKNAETTVPGAGVKVSDKDNIFMVFDGEIASYALNGLSLSWELKAECILDGKWTFPVSVYVETQGGEAFSTTLGVRRQGRLVMTCEIPETLVSEPGEWTIKVMVGDWEHEMKLVK